jgi:putative FmdB family regulatory protein
MKTELRVLPTLFLRLLNMPTYDYECDGCGHKFEEFQSMMDKVLKKCPACKKPKLRRLLGTGAAIIFKGSGFYQTDYRSESYKSGAKADESKSAPPKADAGANGTPPTPGATPASEPKSNGEKKESGKKPKPSR